MAERVPLAAPTTNHKTSSETTRAPAKRRETADSRAGSFADARAFGVACFFLDETGTRRTGPTTRREAAAAAPLSRTVKIDRINPRYPQS